MPFRTDDEIRRLSDDAMSAYGEPRCLFMTGVLPLAGLSYENTATRDEYVRRVFPFDEWKVAYQYAATASACGIVTEIGWRYAGVDWPVIYQPYTKRVAKGQFAVVEEIKAGKVCACASCAKVQGCWIDTVHWTEGGQLPLPGDAPTIGCASCGGDWSRNSFNGEHEYTVLCYDPDVPGTYHSLDGGQPGIAFRTRATVQVFTGEDSEGRRTGELWVAAVDKQGRPLMASDGRPSTGRRMVGYVSVPGLQRHAAEGPCLTSGGEEVGDPWYKRPEIIVPGGLLLGVAGALAARRWGPALKRRLAA